MHYHRGMRIVTWNVNSIRLRLPLIEKLAVQERPDIICLQETKVEDAHFPQDALKALGFSHLYFSGQKSYNGVALLSKAPLAGAYRLPVAGSDHCRHIAAQLPDGTELHNFYVPAGGDVPDPELNPAFGFKLRFVEWMTTWFSVERKPGQRVIAVGDFNIAPYENDVWSHRQLLRVVSHTPPEVERLNALRSTLDWCDTARYFTPQDRKLYSWWSYRNRDWRKSDRGRRLDHVWVTPPLTSSLRGVFTLKDARGWNTPSDHVPVVLDLAL